MRRVHARPDRRKIGEGTASPPTAPPAPRLFPPAREYDHSFQKVRTPAATGDLLHLLGSALSGLDCALIDLHRAGELGLHLDVLAIRRRLVQRQSAVAACLEGGAA